MRGDPEQALGLAEIAMAAHSSLALPDGVEGHLDASAVYNPPNLTFPFGAYICVTDVDPATGEVTVRRFIAVDDCGVRINPMIVEGQVHRGLADGIGMALMQAIVFDEAGNCLGGSFMDYLLPTAMECPSFELGATVTPSPHHPIGAKGVGESATVGSPAAVVNSVIDALAPVRRDARGHAADARQRLVRHPRPPGPVRPRALLTPRWPPLRGGRADPAVAASATPGRRVPRASPRRQLSAAGHGPSSRPRSRPMRRQLSAAGHVSPLSAACPGRRNAARTGAQVAAARLRAAGRGNS